MSTSRKYIRRPIPDEGRKVLYRLLLFAVAVVYALVFVLDYLLQLHFTFFLLLSLFGFVILTLLYMWFRVSGTQEVIVDEEQVPLEEEKKVVPAFEDPVFIISTSSGLILDCSDEALRLFETDDKNSLLGHDLNSFMTADWTPEEKLQIRRSLDSQGRASATAEYVSLRGRKFRGVMQVVKSTVDDQRVLTARITDLSNLKAEQEKSDVSTSASSLDTFDITYKKYFEEGFQAMAFVGINYKFTHANKAFCNLTGYSEQELQQMSFLDILHPDDKEKERKNVSLLFRGEVPISK
ncbi:MAG: PAS domain S-box protein [Bacteroidetes bacterium]|nr:PAS domain S-box protein [Bacteroidota bacterium]